MAALGINDRLLLLVAVVFSVASAPRTDTFRSYRTYRSYTFYRSKNNAKLGPPASIIIAVIFGIIAFIVVLGLVIFFVRLFCCRNRSGNSKSSGGTVTSSSNTTTRYAASPRPATTVNNDHPASYPYSISTDYKNSYNHDRPSRRRRPRSNSPGIDDRRDRYPDPYAPPPPVGLSDYSADTNGGLPYSAHPSEGAGYSYSSPAPSAPIAHNGYPGRNSRPIGFEGTSYSTTV